MEFSDLLTCFNFFKAHFKGFGVPPWDSRVGSPRTLRTRACVMQVTGYISCRIPRRLPWAPYMAGRRAGWLPGSGVVIQRCGGIRQLFNEIFNKRSPVLRIAWNLVTSEIGKSAVELHYGQEVLDMHSFTSDRNLANIVDIDGDRKTLLKQVIWINEKENTFLFQLTHFLNPHQGSVNRKVEL